MQNLLVMSYAGKNFRHLRKLKGWTQEEFAQRLEVKRSLIGAYEEERADPKLEAMEKVCKIFKLTLDDLMLKDLTAPKAASYLEQRRNLKNGIICKWCYSFGASKSCCWLFEWLCRPRFFR